MVTASTCSTRPASPLLAIQSLDSRAAALAEELGGDGNGARLHAICLQAPWPSQTPTLLAWVKRHAPEAYARAGTAFLCKDFVTWRLTGRRVSEISDLTGAGMLRMPECRYDAELLAGYGLDDALPLLPEFATPTDVVGQRHRRGRRGDRAGGRHTGCRRPVRRSGERAGLGRGRTRDRPRSSSARGASTRSSRAR